LVARKYLGVPPEALMTSFVPVYLTFAGLLAFLAFRMAQIYGWHAAPRE
jgi:hypothetical protein